MERFSRCFTMFFSKLLKLLHCLHLFVGDEALYRLHHDSSIAYISQPIYIHALLGYALLVLERDSAFCVVVMQGRCYKLKSSAAVSACVLTHVVLPLAALGAVKLVGEVAAVAWVHLPSPSTQ